MSQLAVPIDSALVAEIVLRSRGRQDVANVVGNVLAAFLDRTKGDPHVWSEEHANEAADTSGWDHRREYGDPTKALHWQQVRLPNGTEVRARGKASVAEVKHQQLVFQGTAMSPSRFASAMWNNTSRSAVRDLEIKFPGQTEWEWAWTLIHGEGTQI